ncbi:hypothetical protein KKB69_02295 [Patescibacteria group bacterium]|nr:hypothetical protein [Patescibacteria group bacterium]
MEKFEDWEKKLEEERIKREAEKELYHKEREGVLKEKKRKEKGGEKITRQEYLTEKIRKAQEREKKKFKSEDK